MKTRQRGPRIAAAWDRETITIPVRFHEVDSMKIAWHGHYVAWCECAREAFLAARGLSYQTMEQHGCPAPVVHMALDYLHPARLGDEITVICAHQPGGEPKLELVYEIRSQAGVLLCAAVSRQVFIDAADGAVRLSMPPIVEQFFATSRTRQPFV